LKYIFIHKNNKKLKYFLGGGRQLCSYSHFFAGGLGTELREKLEMTVYVFQYFLIDQLAKESVLYTKWIADVCLPTTVTVYLLQLFNLYWHELILILVLANSYLHH